MQGSIDRASEALERHHRAALAGVVVALTALAFMNRFVQDDAFISFRYARNLAEGAGLTWNPGERVEGYTNFLWTLVMAIPFSLGIDPVRFAHAVGLALFPGTLLFTDRIARAATGSKPLALLAVALLGTNYTFSAYATGGLETQLHVFALTGATALSLARDPDAPMPSLAAVAISLLAAVALMCRMDSAILLVVLYLYTAVSHPRGAGLIRTGALMVAPGAALVLGWLAWKQGYYGDILPNTYYAKLVPVSEVWQSGVRFLWLFVRSYGLLAVLLLPVLALPRMRSTWNRRLTLLAVMVVAGAAYALRVGGDFMEFRLLVPVLPALFVLIAWAAGAARAQPWAGALVCGALVVASFHHAHTFVIERGVESIGKLQAHLESPDAAWIRIGEVMDELFGDLEPPPRIAVTAAGAIPYFADLPSVDMHGITDPFVARNGLRTDPERTNPGHHRRAPFDYLVERDVNLVIGHPWVAPRKPGPRPPFGQHGLKKFGIVDTPPREEIPEDAVMRVLEIDLDEGHRVYVLYLMADEAIDRVVEEREIRRHRVATRRATRPPS